MSVKFIFMKRIILIILVSAFCLNCTEGKKSKMIAHHNILAYNLLADQIKEQILISPSSAIFPSSSVKAEHTKYLGDNVYLITSYVESQNNFGAMIKTNFSSKVVFKEDGGVSFPDFKTY